MKPVERKIIKIVQKIYREFVTDRVDYFKLNQALPNSSPYGQKRLNQRNYNKAIRLNIFIDVVDKSQQSSAIGGEIMNNSSFLARVDELQEKGLWNFDLNKTTIKEDDVFVYKNSNYIINKVNEIALIKDTYFLVDFGVYISPHAKLQI